MYRKVLVAYDGTGCADLALSEAMRMAEEGACLLVLCVADCPSLAGRVVRGQSAASAEAEFTALERSRVAVALAEHRLAARGIAAELMLVDQTESGGHCVAQTILAEARNTGCDLIVMGTHGRQGLRRFLQGSVAEQVVRESSCPVLLVRGEGPAVTHASPATVYGSSPGHERVRP
jgi:nucleotide-binding universal stress UspA family protein